MTKVFSILVALLLACSSCDAAAPAPLTSWEFQWSQKENKLGTAQLAPESALPSEKGWKRIKLPFNPPKRHDGRYLWLRVALPHFDAMQDAALYISSVELFADFYLNGQRIYRSEPEAGPLRSLRFRGWNPHLLSLPPEASGKILYVHVFSNHANIGFSNNILLGPSRELIKTLFLDEIDMFVVGVLCWLAVLLQLILFASNPRVKYYIFSALFCASLGCYDFVFYKGTKYFFAGIANGLYTFEAVTFIAMPTTFFMLISHEFKTRAKILAKALTAGGALLFVILCLSIFGRGDLRLTLITWNSFLWIFGTIVIIGICPFEYRKRDTDTRIIIVGMILMLLLAGNAILVTNNMVHWKVKLTSASHLAFVITLVMVALRKFFAEHREKERVQAEALTVQRQAAENLEKEVARKTHDLKQRTQELESAYTRLAEHDRLKSRFFTNISHELRTPLTLILAPLKRMLTEEQAKLPPGIIQRLEAMVGNTHRLLRLVNQLLDFSRLESGSETVSNQWVDLHSIVGGVIRAFEPFARSKGLSLELRAPKKMQKVFTDSQKLDKVLCNLLSNACKFTKEGGSIVVRIEETKEQVSIAVKDTGIGIAIDDQNRIFERFYQVDSSTSRRFEGTGIGLSLSRELIELCRGTLTVESEPDAGSTFIITLPCEKGGSPPAKATAPEIVESMERRAHNTAAALEAELGMRNIRRSAVSEGQHLSGNEKLQPTKQADAPQKAQSEPPILENAGVSIINNTKPKVVVIDDNADMRDLVAEICEQDFETVQAADGSAGLDVIHKTKPALIISDIMMPVMDGYELLRRVREDPATASIPILLLTAKSGDEMRLEGLESGADDYLVKPFDARELLARTRNLIRLCEQEQELKRLNSELQQEVIYLATRLDRARRLQQFLPPKIASKILEEGQPVEIAQERQPITVFSMKIKGFDRLSEAIAPEDMAAMLNSYLSSAVDVVFSNGGTLNTLLQDLIVGFVGAPESQGAKEDAIICARMSQELLKRTAEVCNGWQAIISEAVPSPAISVASGYAVVGNFGTNHRIEYSAVGRLVNEALAMLEHSKCGEVVCNQRTLSLIDGTLEGQLSAQMMFMNRSKPVNIYRIASLSGAAMPHQSHSETISISGQLSSQLNPNPTQKNFIDAPPTLLTPTSEGKKGGSPSSNSKKSSRIGVGTVLADRFRIERCLGEGGMGEIFLAIDLKLETAVALKVVRQDLKRERHIKSLYREVKLTRLINHPNVAQMHNLHEWQEHEFITMEYIEGQSLEERLKENPSISIDRAKHILLQLCTGLSAAHLAGVVHGDLKPANIMLGQNWRTVILDFGISRWITSPSMTNTQTNTYCGTPFYMAPEQFEGKPLDIRSDIYSLGVVAFELFTGRKPFVADHVVRLAYLHAQEKPPDPLDLRSGLHPRIAAVILRCLEKAPKNRFNAVAEISALLSENRPEMRRTSVQLGR